MMMAQRWLKVAAACTLLAMSRPSGMAAAQDTQGAPETAGDIVITARQSGAPMWEVRSGGAIVVLVGEITEVPKRTPWQPGRLERATTGADRVILGTKAKVSPGDLFRLLFKGGKLRKLPKGRTVDDYLSPADGRRLAALMDKNDDYRRRSLLITAFDLLTKKLRFNRETTDDATDVVRAAARRATVPMRPVGTVRGKDLIDSLFEAPPEASAPCLRAAIVAAEDGDAGVERRGRDWTERNVAGVMASPIERALALCWPWADGRFGAELRQQWVGAIDGALSQSGVTLAVVPLRVLAEPNGVLDRLAAQKLTISGPIWRK